MANTITVQGAGDDRRVVLWEKHEDHPKGEVFVSNDGKPYPVAETAAVKQRLADGRLVKAEAAPKTATKEQPFEGYDALSVEEVTARVRDLDDQGRGRVLAYEQANKKRTGVIQPLVNWNS